MQQGIPRGFVDAALYETGSFVSPEVLEEEAAEGREKVQYTPSRPIDGLLRHVRFRYSTSLGDFEYSRALADGQMAVLYS